MMDYEHLLEYTINHLRQLKPERLMMVYKLVIRLL